MVAGLPKRLHTPNLEENEADLHQTLNTQLIVVMPWWCSHPNLQYLNQV